VNAGSGSPLRVLVFSQPHLSKSFWAVRFAPRWRPPSPPSMNTLNSLFSAMCAGSPINPSPHLFPLYVVVDYFPFHLPWLIGSLTFFPPFEVVFDVTSCRPKTQFRFFPAPCPRTSMFESFSPPSRKERAIFPIFPSRGKASLPPLYQCHGHGSALPRKCGRPSLPGSGTYSRISSLLELPPLFFFSWPPNHFVFHPGVPM